MYRVSRILFILIRNKSYNLRYIHINSYIYIIFEISISLYLCFKIIYKKLLHKLYTIEFYYIETLFNWIVVDLIVLLDQSYDCFSEKKTIGRTFLFLEIKVLVSGSLNWNWDEVYKIRSTELDHRRPALRLEDIRIALKLPRVRLLWRLINELFTIIEI